MKIADQADRRMDDWTHGTLVLRRRLDDDPDGQRHRASAGEGRSRRGNPSLRRLGVPPLWA